MRQRPAWVAALSLCFVGCSCAQDHTIPVDAWREDGGPGTECIELPSASYALGTDCANWAANCPDFFQGLAAPGDVALSAACLDHACRNVDHCVSTGEGPRCYCGDNGGCLGICVAGADRVPRCVSPCLRERTPVRACAALTLPVPGVALSFWATGCDTDAAHACRLWAQSMAPPGTHALATCAARSAAVYCLIGDECTSPDAGPTSCTCGGATCAATQVCVSNETGDATPHCVEACWATP